MVFEGGESNHKFFYRTELIDKALNAGLFSFILHENRHLITKGTLGTGCRVIEGN